jgi:3-phenylpropionate/cinnamic acid dioxygenase small subunit
MIGRQQGWRAEAPAPLPRVLVLLLLAALAAPAATFYVTISGLGGEPDYDQRFKMWAQDIDSSLKKAGTPDPDIVTLIAPTREQIRARFASLASNVKATDNLVVVLIGHGTFDGVDYKFNVPGPDLTGAELSTLLDRVPSARQLVVVTTSCSGGAIEFLRKPNRIVIAATKAGTEKNATIFARYWAEALRDPFADVDKNESVSALEAFRFAQRKTKEFFDTQKRLATEHSVFEDTGKGSGVAAAAAPDSSDAEGRLAASFTVVRLGANAAASKDPAKKALLEKKEELEQAIDQLKYEKASMNADDYKKQLTRLLLELAKTQEEIDK